MSRQSDASLAVKTVKKLMQTLWCHSSHCGFSFLCCKPATKYPMLKLAFYHGPTNSLINISEMMIRDGSQQKPLKMAFLSKSAFHITTPQADAQFTITFISFGWTEMCSFIPQYTFYGRLSDQLTQDRMAIPNHNLVLLKQYKILLRPHSAGNFRTKKNTNHLWAF